MRPLFFISPRERLKAPEGKKARGFLGLGPVLLLTLAVSAPAFGQIDTSTVSYCSPLSPTFTGQATYYQPAVSPAPAFNCTVPFQEAATLNTAGNYWDGNFAAIDSTDYNALVTAGVCDACAQVSYNATTIVVPIIDQCGCPGFQPPTDHHLDLSTQDFISLTGGTSAGLVPISWNLVQCPMSILNNLNNSNPSGNITYYYNFGEESGIYFYDTAFPLTSVTANGSALTRSASNNWQATFLFTGPTTFVLTDALGASVTTVLTPTSIATDCYAGDLEPSYCAVTAGTAPIGNTGVQFPGCVTGPTATPTASDTSTSTPTPTASPTSTLTRTSTPTPTVTSTETPTGTATASFTPTESPTSTFTRTSTPTATDTASTTSTPTAVHTATFTYTPTSTVTPVNTSTSTPTPTFSFTAVPTFSPTFTPSHTFTFTQTPTPTPTGTATASLTPTESPTSTLTRTPSYSPSPTLTVSPIPPTATTTPTFTPLSFSTFTQTLTPTPTGTATATSTLLFTSTPSATAFSTVTGTSTVTNTSTSTATPVSTSTSTPTSTLSFTAVPTFSPTFTPSQLFTFTQTPTPTLTVTPTPTSSSTSTRTASPTVTFTITSTKTFTGTPTFTPTSSSTGIPTFTLTFTPSHFYTFTQTVTPAVTNTPTFTATPVSTPTSTPTPTLSFTAVPTFSPTFTPSSLFTFTQTLTPTASATPIAPKMYVSLNILHAGQETVTVRISGPYAGSYSLRVYNSAGEYITTLAGFQSGGPTEESYAWDGRNRYGDYCASGVYLFRFAYPYGSLLARVVLVH